MGVTLDGLAILFIEQLPQHGQIVFLLVDCLVWHRRCRPGQRGIARRAGTRFEPLVVRYPPRGRAHHIEGVEGRYTRARFGQFDPRIRDIQPIGRRAACHLEQEPLGGESVRLGRQRWIGLEPQRVQQEGILTRLLRKHPLGQAWHEDDAEAAATRLLWRPHEDPAEPSRRWRGLQRQQPVAQHPARLVEVDRAHVRHRSQIREHPQHVRGRAKHARRKTRKTVQPFAPRARSRPGGQFLDDGKRELLEALQLVLDLAQRLRTTAVFTVFAHGLSHLRIEFGRLTSQPPPPARRVMADDRRVHEQPFPLPGSPQCSRYDRRIKVSSDGAATFCQVEVIVRVAWHRIQSVARLTDPVRQSKRFVCRHHVGCVGRVPRLVRRSRAGGSGPAWIRHLTQRKIFGEPRSRELFSGTRQQREKRAPGWMRPSCASVEPCRYAGPPKRMFEQTEVAVGGTNEDRHLVEQHARPCFSKHPARHFNAFASLARRGKELDGPVELAQWRMALGVEEKSTDTRQVVERIRAFRFENHSAHRREMPNRVAIPRRHSREDTRGAGCQGLDELSLRSMIQRDVEQHDPVVGLATVCRLRAAKHCRGCAKEASSIDRPRVGEAGVEAFEQSRQVRTRQRQGRKRGPADLRKAELLQRSRQRPWKARCRRDRGKVLERGVSRRLECGSRGDSLRAERGAGRRSIHRECDQRGPCGKLGEAQTLDAKGGWERCRQFPHQIVSGPARGAHDQPSLTSGSAAGHFPRRRQPCLSGRGHDDTNGAVWLGIRDRGVEKRQVGHRMLAVPVNPPGLRYGSTTLPNAITISREGGARVRRCECEVRRRGCDVRST